ncbi:hypothetical protein CGZ96_10820 [Enemella evansiae]|nr:hypothetical protein CGZ96_10820 [Enemella evansiae]
MDGARLERTVDRFLSLDRRAAVERVDLAAAHRCGPGRARRRVSAVTLRPAGPADADAGALLEQRITTPAFAHIFPPAEFPFPVQEIRAKWHRELADPAYLIWWAERDGTGLGYCATHEDWIDHLGVLATEAGTGLAHRLLQQGLRTIAERGYASARLWVLAENHRARAFYAKHGWIGDGTVEATEYPPHPAKLRYRIDL